MVSPANADPDRRGVLVTMDDHDRLVGEGTGRHILTQHAIAHADRLDCLGAARRVDQSPFAEALQRGRPARRIDDVGQSRLGCGLACLKGITKLVRPPALPLFGLGAQFLPARRLDDRQQAGVERVDLIIDRFDRLDVLRQGLRDRLVCLADLLQLIEPVSQLARRR